MKNKNSRNLDFEIKTSVDLTKMLTGMLMDLRRGEIEHKTARSITLVADKINKNASNAIEYKKITGHTQEIEFFKE